MGYLFEQNSKNELTPARPVRTYNTAVVYYQKFRLVHPDGQGYLVSKETAPLLLLFLIMR